MKNQSYDPSGRKNDVEIFDSDVTIVGGGLAGVCCAIAAARQGMRVTLVQDRPVLGGNSSSEVRLWALGATSHMGNNNRWSREGGIINEILLDNLYKNKSGNPVIFDIVLMEKVVSEPNITLLLNTSVFNTVKSNPSKIESLNAFCSQNSLDYILKAKFFCDASGDGIVAFQSGSSFRMGAESQKEFDEKLAGDEESMNLLGHSIYFYTKDVGQPVDFVPPHYANIDDIAKERVSRINPDDMGCRLWWLEHGGTFDTIKDSEKIKFDLWSIVYGVWDHIKNSGEYEGVENLTLEWVGSIPGKRESRRFNGHYMLTQSDVVEQLKFEDAVSYGGWSIDHHPSQGVYTEASPCTQYHSKGTYQIPLRCFISKDIDNLFFAGRIISASHIAFGSTRVMLTCAHGGQSVGYAMAQCVNQQLKATDLLAKPQISTLQNSMNELGHFIPGVALPKSNNLISGAHIRASSTLQLDRLALNLDTKVTSWRSLSVSAGQWLPLRKATKYSFDTHIMAMKATSLFVELRVSTNIDGYTPDSLVEKIEINVSEGFSQIHIPFENELQDDQYALLCFMQNDYVSIASSKQRVSGIVSVFNGKNKAVSNNGKQIIKEGKGIESFEFWIPERRPAGENLALQISPAIDTFTVENINNGFTRPYIQSNAWIAAFNDSKPELKVEWSNQQTFKEILIHLDGDFDHALECSLMGHPERTIPFCIAEYEVTDEDGNVIYKIDDNTQSFNHIHLKQACTTKILVFKFSQKYQHIPVSVFEIIVR